MASLVLEYEIERECYVLLATIRLHRYESFEAEDNAGFGLSYKITGQSSLFRM
jgi:hypothetical protein